MTALSLNKQIYAILSQDSGITSMCQSIYPVVAEEDVKFPFILYRRETIQPYDCKGYTVGDRCNFSIVAVSDKYAVTVELAERIRQLFEKRRDGYFTECNLTGCSEDFVNEAYTQQLDFQATIMRKDLD